MAVDGPVAGRVARPARPARPPRRSADALILRALAAFHAAALTALLVLAAHLGGSLGLALQSIGTGTGIVVYAALWTISTWTTRRALDGIELDSAGSLPRLELAQPAFVWGSVTGIAFFLVLLGIQLAKLLIAVDIPSGEAMQAFASIGALAIAGLLVAAVVGGLVGLALGAVDRVLIGAGLAIARWAGAGDDATE